MTGVIPLKRTLIVLLLAALALPANADTTNLFFGCSSSVLWGQGFATAGYRWNSTYSTIVEESFVMNSWSRCSYTMTSAYLRQKVGKNSAQYGVQYGAYDHEPNWQREFSPFVSFFHPHKDYYCDFTHKLEYRTLKWDDDYWRMLNAATVYWPRRYTEYKIQPYVTYALYTDLRDVSHAEKSRLYAGVRFKLIEQISVRVYFVETYGERSESWDDTHHFGLVGTMTF